MCTFVSDFRISHPRTGRRVNCLNCAAYTGAFATEEEAVEYWNRRPHAPAQSALDELRREVERLTKERDQLADARNAAIERQNFMHTMTRDAQEIAATANEQAAEARREVEALRADAERYRWLRGFATPGQRPSKDEMPMGYREIRLRVDTPVYMPSHWTKDVDRLIDAAMKAEADIDSLRETNGSR